MQVATSISAKQTYHSRHIELKELHVDWVQHRFCHKSYGNSSFFFFHLLHYNCYCVQSLLKNATSCGFHVVKIRKGMRYWLEYIGGKLFEKGKYYLTCWKIYKGLDTQSIVWCDNYHEAFSTFRCKLESEYARVKVVTIIHEDYEYCLYLLIELFEYAMFHSEFYHFQNQCMLFLVFNPITTTFLYVLNCWVLKFKWGLIYNEAKFSIVFPSWMITVWFGIRTYFDWIAYGNNIFKFTLFLIRSLNGLY